MAQELRTVSEGPPDVPETAAIISVIERAAQNPAVDIDKMERLFEMHERVKARNAKEAFAAAMASMQAQLPVIGKRGNIEIREKDKEGRRTGPVQQSTSYALWEDINEAIKPVLAAHGFSLSFRTGLHGDGRILVTGILKHSAGHEEETTMILPHDSTGSKNPVQAIGSSTSYGKRYTASALLNLTSRGEDDDGVSGGAKTISQDQLNRLIELADNVGADKAKFCDYLKVDSFAAIKAQDYGRAVTSLQAKGARK